MKTIALLLLLCPALALAGGPVAICNYDKAGCATITDGKLEVDAAFSASDGLKVQVTNDGGTNLAGAGSVLPVRTDPGSISRSSLGAAETAVAPGIVSDATVTTQVAAAPSVGGQKNCLRSVTLANLHASTAVDLSIVHGTGAACATGKTAIVKLPFEARSGTTITAPLEVPWCAPADRAICVEPSAAVNFSAIVLSYTSP